MLCRESISLIEPIVSIFKTRSFKTIVDRRTICKYDVAHESRELRMDQCLDATNTRLVDVQSELAIVEEASVIGKSIQILVDVDDAMEESSRKSPAHTAQDQSLPFFRETVIDEIYEFLR